MIAWMRYLVDVAGDLNKLLYAVRTAYEAPSDNPRTLWETMVTKYKKEAKVSAPRSAEPHFSFARELGLLAKREGAWNVTSDAGKAFLALTNEQDSQIPTYLLIAQLLKNDRTFLMPFLANLLSQKTGGGTSFPEILPQAYAAVEKTWKELWFQHEDELKMIEPRIPTPNEVGPRTMRHHALVRVRFLTSKEGLHLEEEQLKGLLRQFSDFCDREMPEDYYYRIGLALSNRKPVLMDSYRLVESIEDAFYALINLKGFVYVSAQAAFYYINSNVLPDQAVSWNQFITVLEKTRKFQLCTSFSPDDVLYSVAKSR
jgi:hypothetical protein